MNDLIERMKKNERTYCFLDKQEKGALKVADKSKMVEVVFMGVGCSPDWGGKAPNEPFNLLYTYRISPDYQPEPEIPVLEGYMLEKITQNNAGTLVYADEVFITFAPNDPNFVGYGYKLKGMEEITITSLPVIWVNCDESGWSVGQSVDLKMRTAYNTTLRPLYVVFKETKDA